MKIDPFSLQLPACLGATGVLSVPQRTIDCRICSQIRGAEQMTLWTKGRRSGGGCRGRNSLLFRSLLEVVTDHFPDVFAGRMKPFGT
eukprot:COSAG02_NODE_2958_length_7663_cov_9.892782_4_plen_87_part_00